MCITPFRLRGPWGKPERRGPEAGEVCRFPSRTEDDPVPTDLMLVLPNRPGIGARLTEAIAAAGINLDGGCAVGTGSDSIVHLLVGDTAAVRGALEGTGFEVRDERDVLITDVENRPGAFAEVLRGLADAGVNVEFAYAAADGHLVIGADDVDRARQVVRTG